MTLLPFGEIRDIENVWRRLVDCDSFNSIRNGSAMFRRLESATPNSQVWLTPDLTLGFHQFEYKEGEYDGLLHTHPEYGIVMCLAGSVEVLYEDRHETLLPGEVLVVNPGEVHRCRFGLAHRPPDATPNKGETQRPWPHLASPLCACSSIAHRPPDAAPNKGETQRPWPHLASPLCACSSKDGPKSKGFTLIVRPAVLHAVLDAMALPYAGLSRGIRFAGKFKIPEAFDMTARLIEEFQEQQRGYGAMIEMMVRQILMYLLRAWPADAVFAVNTRSSPQLPWLHMHRATEYMNAHGKGEFRLSNLCGHVGVSASRFIPLFKSSSGISPHTYYNSLIVFKAHRLLQVEHLSTKEAAYALGFRNVSHFCTLFHQVTGGTPQGDRALPGQP